MEVCLSDLLVTRDGRVVLDIPSLTFPEGVPSAVFGPNGSGKSTLLRVIAGLLRPSTGAPRVGTDRVEAGCPPERVAIAFQNAVFLRGSVRQNLDLALELRGLTPAEREARVEEVSRECDLGEVLERPARRLSGGEAQRVNLARALALRAPVTLLDEPLAGIDRITRTHLLDDLPRLLSRFASTTIIVTHDREEAFRLADHLVILSAGRVVAAGPKDQVYRCPEHRETAELLGYTVLPWASRLVGVPPGGLRIGQGSPGFELLIDRVVDMGDHHHLLGRVGSARVDLRLPAGSSPPVVQGPIRIHAARFVTLD